MRTRMASVLLLAAFAAASLQGQTEEPKQAATPKPASHIAYADLDDDGWIDLFLADEEGAPDRQAQAARESKPASLEEMLTQALKNHPDVRIAEAKVTEAEAELDRARLQVTQKIIAAHRAIEDQRAQVRAAEQQVQDQTRMVQKGFKPAGELERAQQVLAERKAKLAELEMELPYLLGKQTRAGNDALRHFLGARQLTHRLDADAAIARGISFISRNQAQSTQIAGLELFKHAEPVGEPMADRIRKALDTPVTVNYKDKLLTEMLKDLEKQVPGVPFVPRLSEHQRNAKLTLELSEKVPLAAALQAIEDVFGQITFGVREYGILAVGDGGIDMMSPQEFWKRSAEPALKPPAKEVQGEVKAVDEKTGLIRINIGSDAGVEKGNTLEIYRLKPKPKYLGPVQLIEVKPAESVGKPMRPASEPLQVGDQVSGSPFQRN